MQYHEEISAIHAGHLTKFFQPRKISLPDNLYSIQQPLSTSRVPNTFQTLRTANIAAQRRSSVEICAPSPTVQSLIHTDLSQRHMRKFIRLTGIHNTVPYLHDRSRPASVYGPTRLEQRHRSVTDILRLTTILPATTLMPDFIQRSIQPRRIYPHRSSSRPQHVRGAFSLLALELCWLDNASLRQNSSRPMRTFVERTCRDIAYRIVISQHLLFGSNCEWYRL